MAEIKIAGIMRAGAYSPNHIGNDAAIFNLTTEQLRKRGCEVKVYSEEQFIAGEVKEDIIVDMCREHRSMVLLQQLEDAGALVINSGYGIENCTRERMTRILLGSNIPYPDSLIVDTDEVVKDRMVAAKMDRAWIKRGDFHAMHKEDVSYVRHPEEAQEVLQEYFLRGIKRAVINRHLVGDLAARRQDQHLGVAVTLAQRPEHRHTVLAGEVQIQHDQIKALDGEHLDPDGHKKLAAAIADIVRRDCEA